ncbi:SLAM family member 9-like [Labeo rohita]|uniref:SLAM family member 9-like n=1 Tax=Labeo rohita TaxID=84645 RepID=UPI0021E208FD|nr:SLAM family member 9-like [Labeo rohita]
MYDMILFCLSLWSLNGVIGVDAAKLVPVSVMEGDLVTLGTDVTEILQNDPIQWRFGDVLIAKIYMKENNIIIHETSAAERLRDRLKLDHQTGSLTITNTRTTDSGLYKIVSTVKDTTLNTYNLTVYAHLPVPVISSNSSQNSSLSSSSGSSASKCVFLCSVVNVSDVTLSWYKGNSLLSSISVSDLNRSVSLHLECLDDSYSCVVNNPISNQTQHLNNTELCQPCSDDSVSQIVLISAGTASAGSLLIVVAVGIFCIHRKRRKTDKKGKHCLFSPTAYVCIM